MGAVLTACSGTADSNESSVQSTARNDTQSESAKITVTHRSRSNSDAKKGNRTRPSERWKRIPTLVKSFTENGRARKSVERERENRESRSPDQASDTGVPDTRPSHQPTDTTNLLSPTFDHSCRDEAGRKITHAVNMENLLLIMTSSPK